MSTQPESARCERHRLAKQCKAQSQHERGKLSRSFYQIPFLKLRVANIHRLSSEPLPPLRTAVRKDLSGASPTELSKKASSPPPDTAKTQSASQSAARLLLSSASSLVPREGKQLAQPLHTDEQCKLELQMRKTTAASRNTAVQAASRKRHSSHQPPCRPPPPLPSPLLQHSQAGSHTTCLPLPFPNPCRKHQARTSSSPWKKTPSARSHTRPCRTHTPPTRSRSVLRGQQSP